MARSVVAGGMRHVRRVRLRAVAAGVGLAVLMTVPWWGGAPARASYRDCSLKTLTSCENMNQLIWAKDFRAAFDAFIDEGSRWHDTLWAALAGVWVKDKVRWLEPDLVRFQSCMLHNCGLKGAVFLSADGRILQAAVIDYPCGDLDCVGKNVVYVLTHDPAPKLVRYAHEWAIEALEIDPAKGHRYNGYWDVTLEWVEVVRLGCRCGDR